MKINSTILLILATSLTMINSCTKNNNEYIKKTDVVDPLTLYTKITELKTVFYEQYGHKTQLPDNVKQCVTKIAESSNVYDYMGSKDALSYTDKSQYAKDGEATFNALNKLMNDFRNIGFIHAIENANKTPAIMFDIDNNIQLTSFDDDWFSKASMATPGALNFIKSQCFRGGVDCYFITARDCNTDSANATAKWLKANLGLNDSQIGKYVFLSGSIENSLCASAPTEKVSYKEAFRQAITDQRNVYWLMSIGDQMTDWYGSNSGMKVWYPNQMFHSDVVPINHDDPSNCIEKTVVAPSLQCYAKLKGGILQHGTINYCQDFRDKKYYAGKN